MLRINPKFKNDPFKHRNFLLFISVNKYGLCYIMCSIDLEEKVEGGRVTCELSPAFHRKLLDWVIRISSEYLPITCLQNVDYVCSSNVFFLFLLYYFVHRDFYDSALVSVSP